MANIEKEDKVLNDYLQGESALSEKYRASNIVEPPAHIDEKILLAANEAVSNTKQKSKPVFKKSPWAMPVSMAAVLTLSVSLIVTMQQETGQPLISEPELDLYDTEAIEDNIVAPTLMVMDEASVVAEDKASKTDEKHQGSNTSASAIISADDVYRVEKKAEPAKAMARERTAEKNVLKEKVFSANKETSISEGRQALRSAPAEAVLGAAMRDLKQVHQVSPQEEMLLKIKKMWQADEFNKAKQSYQEFIKNNPDFSIVKIKKILGTDLYESLILANGS